MTHQFYDVVSTNVNENKDVAEKLISFAGEQKIFLFYGDMGAGKTTFIKAMGEYLGVTGPVTSPTFSIVNEYSGPLNKAYHFDFYRLKNETEALDMGYEEYFYSGDYCFVEWPEKIAGLLPPHYIRVTIQVLDNNERRLNFEQI